MRGSLRRGVAVLLVGVPALAIAACEDVGLPDRNTPEAEAAERPFRYVVYEAAAPMGESNEVVMAADAPGVGGTAATSRHWLPSGAAERIPDALLRPVAGTGGATLYALTWDDAPYERLYAAGSKAGTYHPLHAVPPVAQRHAAEAYGPAEGHGAAVSPDGADGHRPASPTGGTGH